MKLNTMSDIEVAKELDVNQSTIYRNRLKPEYAEYIEKAEQYLDNLAQQTYTTALNNWEIFCKIPIIKEWDKILNIRRVTDARKKSVKKSIWHLCKYLKQHPSRLNVKEVAEFVVKIRDLYYEGKKQPYGLSYSTLREGVRSYFTLVKHISGEYLTQLGVDKSELKGSGIFAKQKISPEVRKEFEKALNKNSSIYTEYIELLALAKWMYYTATRINASLTFNFNERRYELTKDIWMFEVLDKGEKGGKLWEKYLTGFALKEFKEYCSNRFNISIDKLETELPKKTNYLFPSFVSSAESGKDGIVREVYRRSLIKAGLPYKNFQPCHIFRHTFAQDFLRATEYNYEQCASLGGWSTTYRLKKHYGELGKDPKINALRKAMGLPVEEEYFELNWYGATRIEKPYKCPECGTQFNKLLGICSKCKYISDSINKWVNPNYEPKSK